MTTIDFINQIRELIANNRIDRALQRLRALQDNSPYLDELILQSARFNEIRKQICLGVVSHTDAMLDQNQIRAGLLDLLREIEHSTGEASVRPDAPALRVTIAF